MMRKKICWILVFAVFILGVSCLSLKEKTLTDKLYPQKPIHVFFEAMATQPAFNGMIEMVRLPKEDPKVFVWHRFPQRAKLMDLSEINAIEIDITHGEGQLYEAKDKLIATLKPLLEKYPKSPLVIYTNMNNYRYLFDGFLKLFPHERIKHVHLYEDGLGELFTRISYFNSISFSNEDILDLKNYYYGDGENKKLPKYAKYMMHLIMPVTYHFYGYHLAVEKKLLSDHFLNLMKEATFKEIDFEEISKKLSTKEKKLLYRLLDFDYEKYKTLSEKYPIFLFFGGYYYDQGSYTYHAEMNYLSSLMKKYPDYYFLLKPHPSYGALNRKRLFDFAISSDQIDIVTPQIPYEIFIIADLLPDKISGRSSSSSYTVDNKRLESYIPHSSYKNGISLMRGLDTSKEVDLGTFIPEKPYFFDEKIQKSGETEYLLIDNKTAVTLYNEKKLYRKKHQQGKELFCHKDNCFVAYQKEGVTYWTPYEKFQIELEGLVDQLIYQNENRYCLEKKKECGRVNKNGLELEICWENSGCEYFIKEKKGLYIRRKMNINKTLEKEFQVNHKHWKDKMILKKNDRYCRLKGTDCGFVKEMAESIEICWENWPCETLQKESKGVYKK